MRPSKRSVRHRFSFWLGLVLLPVVVGFGLPAGTASSSGAAAADTAEAAPVDSDAAAGADSGQSVETVSGTAEAPASTLGLYAGSAPNGPAAISSFEGWLGQPVRLGSDFVGRSSWTQIANPDALPAWSSWVAAVPERRLVLAVPMLAGPDAVMPHTAAADAETASLLRQGAAGSFDGYFRTLAERLTARGMGDTIVRLGWEHHGGWFRWRSRPDPGAWAAYYRRIVAVMRQVPGGQFNFVWNPGVGIAEWYNGSPYYSEVSYPGSDVVDWVGINIFDYSWDQYPYPSGATAEQRLQRQQAAWSQQAWGDHGLAFWQNFAASHGKAMVVPEWGVQYRADGHGGGDDPYFVERMHDWITSRGIPWHVYFNFDGADARAALSNFPLSRDRFLNLFGGGAIAIGAGGGGNQPAYVNAHNRVGGQPAVGTPVNNVHTWGPGCIQDLAGGMSVRAALMARGCGWFVFAVNGAHWAHMVGNYGGAAADIVGYPLGDSHRWGAGWAQDFGGGAHGWNILMLGDGLGFSRSMAVRGAILDRYRSWGGPLSYLGYPVTNEYWWNGQIRQDFQGGSLVWSSSSGVQQL